MLPMGLGAFGRGCFNLSIMSTSNTAASFYKLFSSIIGAPSAFDHFLKVFFHVLKLSLDFDGVLLGVASLSFFLVANLLKRAEGFSDGVGGFLGFFDGYGLSFPDFDGTCGSSLDLDDFISGGLGEGIDDVKVGKFFSFFIGEEEGDFLEDFADIDFALNRGRITM